MADPTPRPRPQPSSHGGDVFITVPLVISGMVEYSPEVKQLMEHAFGLSIGACSDDCSSYAPGVIIHSSVADARRSSGITVDMGAKVQGVSAAASDAYVAAAWEVATPRGQDSLQANVDRLLPGSDVTDSSPVVERVLPMTDSRHAYAGEHPSATCGDGRVEAVPETGRCPMVGSGPQAAGSVVEEHCDVATTARFGSVTAGCGLASSCALQKYHRVELAEVVEDSPSGRAQRSAQLQYGLMTDSMRGSRDPHDFDPYAPVSATNVLPRINPCLYSTQLILPNGSHTRDFAAAAGCEITDADRTKYTVLANCYATDTVTALSTAEDLKRFGQRLDEADDKYALYGHKCQWPASLSVDSVTGGVMTWQPTPRDINDRIVDDSATNEFPGLYDVCFTLSDPSWPAVHPSSHEFIPQITRLQYQIICDPLDQETAFPDDGDDCEVNVPAGVNGSYHDTPRQHSHKCTRLGNRKNPCSNVHRQFELYSCDATSCESLEGLSSDYHDRYGASADSGVVYSFEHDSEPSKNRFQCPTKQFDNTRLFDVGAMAGDATAAQSKYVCATGGQDEECATDMGEIVHHVDTCSTGIRYRDNLALKDRLSPLGKWKDLSTLYNQRLTVPNDVSSATAGTNPAVNCALTPDDADCAVYKFYRDLQQYPTGCGRRLKLRVLKGVSGQMLLRVVARSYNTAIDDADPDRGYTYWTSSLIPVSIAARVKPIGALENIGRTATAASVHEKGNVQLFGDDVATNPFKSMAIGHSGMTDEASRIARYSRSTRAHMEIIDCTASHDVLAVEADKTVPRFRLSTASAFDRMAFGGDYDYSTSFSGAQYAAGARIYGLKSTHAYEAPLVSQLQSLDPKLTLRAAGDGDSAWWRSVNPDIGLLDSYHEGYSTKRGLCFVNRLYVFEPSSCDYHTTDSPPYWLNVQPVNRDARPTVSFEQTTRVWAEDETVPLRVNVAHPGSDDDSKMWYFSHVVVEDMNGAVDAQNGGGFDLFSYGHTVGDSAGGDSDTVTEQAGITSTGKLWRSFANKCTRWLFEKGRSYPGGFANSTMASVASDAGFADPEACLDDARRQGEAIWGGTGTPGPKSGIFLRPYRKMTKNVRVRATVYMYDGDAFGWHADDATLERTGTSSVLELLHVPGVTRYDQREIFQVAHATTENGNVPITFNVNSGGGVGLPLAYRPNAHLCTYVRAGDATTAAVDEVSTSPVDHDRACTPTGPAPSGVDAEGGSLCAEGECFGGAPDRGCRAETGYRLTCESSGADAARAVIETLIVFDESEAANDAGETYLDGSDSWTDGAMAMPERLAYQPAGNNPMAHDGQWYRLRACADNPDVANVYWCDSATSAGNDTAAGGTGAGICDITDKGVGADAPDAPGGMRSPLQNSISIDRASGSILASMPDGGTGYSENFWILNRTTSNGQLSAGSLCLQGRSDFNTEGASWDTAADSPLNLRLVAVALDTVTATSGVDAATPTWAARSKSDTNQGSFVVAIEPTRQLVQPRVLEHTWAETFAVDGGSATISFVEERNDASQPRIPPRQTWTDVDARLAGTLQPDVDCGGGNASDTFCADNVRFTETTNFHDQHLGRVEVKGYFQKTCAYVGDSGNYETMGQSTWQPAGGLFDVYVQYADDYPEYGDQHPGNGFDLNMGAGHKVSECLKVDVVTQLPVCSIVHQSFRASAHGTQLNAGAAGGSICRIILDGDLDHAQTASVRNTACHMRAVHDVVGHDTLTWSDTVLHRVVRNKCHKPAGGVGDFDCPAGPLSAREIASNLRFRLPHKWSNCVRFKFEVSVSNDDRAKPSLKFESGAGATSVSYRSGPAVVYVQPQPRAEEPVMWLTTDLSDESGCLGAGSAQSCKGHTGVRAVGDLEGGYKTVDVSTNLDGGDGEAMTRVLAVAGYPFQVRALVYSEATDTRSDPNRESEERPRFEGPLDLTGKLARCSDCDDHGGAAAGNDGDPATVTHTDAPFAGGWWSVDMGGDHILTSVVLTPRLGHQAQSDGMTISVDGVKCATTSGFSFAPETAPRAFACHARGRHLNVTSATAVIFAEVSVVHTDASMYALDMATREYASSHTTKVDLGGAWRAFDGDASTYAMAANFDDWQWDHTVPQWISVDLGAVHDVATVSLTPRQDCCHSQADGLLLAIDGVVCATTSGFAAGTGEATQFACPARGRFLNISNGRPNLPSGQYIYAIAEVGVSVYSSTPAANTNYGQDSARSRYQMSGEHVHVTVESKYDAMVPGAAPQRFCLWVCPENTPAGRGCAKSQLVRVRPLPDRPATGSDPHDFNSRDVNCDACTGDEATGCVQYGVNPDGTPQKCRDNYKRDDTLLGCPAYSTVAPYHNPGHRYSFKCTKTGHCPEAQNMYVQYPGEQISDDVLEFSAVSRADWRGADGYQRARLSMNVLTKPSISLSAVGFAVEARDTCDADRANLTCATGFYGPPVQPSQNVTLVPSVHPPITVVVQETQLHGPNADSLAKCSSLNAEPDLASRGSSHDASTECGMRFPVNFKDASLTAVAPIGVKFNVRASHPSIDAKDLAQALRVLCTKYARDSTGAEASTCVGQFTAINKNSPNAENVDLLRFQSADAQEPDPVTRLVDWDDFRASAHPASHLSWNVGEPMARKEMVLMGSDSAEYSLTDYSFDNNRCENDRFFSVELEHRAGYNPSVVAETRSAMSVRVEDDDFYGRVQLAGVSENRLYPLSQMAGSAAEGRVQKAHWNADGDGHDTAFSVYLMRSRLVAESDTASKRAVQMKPLRAWIKVDLGTLNTNEFQVRVSQVHGSPEKTVVTHAPVTAADVLRGDGVTPNMIAVDLPAPVPDTSDCNLCDAAGPDTCYHDCQHTEGSPDRDVPFQFFKVAFEAVGPPAGCNEGDDKVIKFNIERVEYTAEAGTALVAQAITCGTDGMRDPLQPAEKSVTFTQTLVVQTEDSHTKAPFRVHLAGMDPSDGAGAEGTKQQPIAWNAGLDGSFVKLTETEHSACTSTGAGGFHCPPRKFRMHLCATLRDVEEDTLWNEWSASTFRFYTGVVDSVDAWSQIGNHYDLACPTADEMQAINDAGQGATVECSRMSSLTKQESTHQVAVHCDPSSPHYPTSEQERYDYCGDHVPSRLLWRVSTDANGARNALQCPTAATSAITGAANPWRKLPFVEFTTKDDQNVVNLSRRPKLCILNDNLPGDLMSGANTHTCSSVAAQNCVALRVQDDELFAQDNSLLDGDVNDIEAEFSEPVWDSVNGRLQIAVSNRYQHSPQEKTLVNVAVGGCEPETAADPGSSVGLREFWEQHQSSTSKNPVTSDTTAFGSCDLLTAGAFPDGLSNAAMFKALFGEGSAQPTYAQYQTLAESGRLFGFTAADVAGQNTLFTPPRDLGVGGEWTVTNTSVDDRGNSDLSNAGFSATLSISLERLQACVDRVGHGAVAINVVDDNTVYEFTMSSTHVRAQRRGDAAFVHYSPMCTERKYSLSVSNTMYALSGMGTRGASNAIYVDDATYRSPLNGVCADHTTCSVAGIGHHCPDAGTYDADTMKLMEYTVNMDMRTTTNVIGDQSVTTFYGLASVADVEVDPANCYGAVPHAVSPVSATGAYVESGVTRTRVTFRTACLELRESVPDGYGAAVADAFATCAADNAMSTNFNFKAKVWECTNQVGLLTPSAAGSGCQLSPDWLRVSIALAYTQSPMGVDYEVKFETQITMYRSLDHRLADGSYPDKTARDAWRADNQFTATEADPYVVYPVDSLLVTSLGFVPNSALEAVMTTSIRQVRLCRFKHPCHLPGVSAPTPGVPQCSWRNLVVDATHSPTALFARNPTLDGGKGCAQLGATTTCEVQVQQTAVGIPRLTCHRGKWENFAIAEASAYMQSNSLQSTLLSNIVDGSGKVLQMATLAMALDPIVEGMLVVDHGATTALAASVHGNCETNAAVMSAPEDIADATGATAGVRLNHIMPVAPANGDSVGACTCKGQRAHEFSPDGGASFPYRQSAARKVVYATDYYSHDAADEASLHKCTWLNAPQHSTSHTPLNSVDQFVMSLRYLQRGEEYFFEMNAVQFDHQAFSQQDLDDPQADQFGSGGAGPSRRMLSHMDVDVNVPRAALRPTTDDDASKGRRTLSLMVPVSDALSARAIMPQGTVKLQEEQTEGAFDSNSVAGFVVGGRQLSERTSIPGTDVIWPDPVAAFVDVVRAAFERTPIPDTRNMTLPYVIMVATSVALLAVNLWCTRRGCSCGNASSNDSKNINLAWIKDGPNTWRRKMLLVFTVSVEAYRIFVDLFTQGWVAALVVWAVSQTCRVRRRAAVDDDSEQPTHELALALVAGVLQTLTSILVPVLHVVNLFAPVAIVAVCAVQRCRLREREAAQYPASVVGLPRFVTMIVDAVGRRCCHAIGSQGTAGSPEETSKILPSSNTVFRII